MVDTFHGTLAALRSIDAGVANVFYGEAGPRDAPGVVGNEPIGARAHLSLARA